MSDSNKNSVTLSEHVIFLLGILKMLDIYG